MLNIRLCGPITGHMMVLTASSVAIVFVLLATIHIYDYALDVDRVVAADNIVTILCQVFIAASVSHLLWDRCRFRFWRTPIDISLAGLFLEPIGWILHRSYWAIWRILRAIGRYDIADKMEGTGAVLTALAVGVHRSGCNHGSQPIYPKDFWKTLVHVESDMPRRCMGPIIPSARPHFGDAVMGVRPMENWKESVDELARELEAASEPTGVRGEKLSSERRRIETPRGAPGKVDHAVGGGSRAPFRSHVPNQSRGYRSHREDRAPIVGDRITFFLVLVAVAVASFRLTAGV